MAMTKNETRLLRYYLKKGVTTFTENLKEIAEKTGLSRATVQRINDSLRSRGLLDWIPGHLLHCGGENRYSISAKLVDGYKRRRLEQ